MEKVALYDNVGKYGYFITKKEELYDIKFKVDNNTIIFIVDNCIDVKEVNDIYKEIPVMCISNEKSLMYLNPSLPMWLENDDTYLNIVAQSYDKIMPLSAEVVPSLNCSFRCEQCSYRPTKEAEGIWDNRIFNNNEKFCMSKETMDKVINKLYNAGTKNIVFTGGGEPLSNSEVTLYGMDLAKKYNLTFGLYSNGFYLSNDICRKLCNLDPLFIRISVYGLNENEFEKYTQIPSKNFYTVISNIKKLIKIKEETNSKFQLSLSFLVNPTLVENSENIESFFENNFTKQELKNIYMVRFTPTVDYYTAHQHSSDYFEKMFTAIDEYSKKVKEYLNIVTYRHRLDDLYKEKEYDFCRGNGFYAEIGPDAKMYLCCEKLTDSKFVLGSLEDKTVKEIFDGQKRKDILQKIANEKCKKCPSVCKPHEINKQLFVLEKLINEGEIKLVNKWREDLIDKSNNSEYFPGRLNAFES